MKSKTLEFTVKMKYTSTNGEPIHIKEWWARNQIEYAIDESMPHQQRLITDVYAEFIGIK